MGPGRRATVTWGGFPSPCSQTRRAPFVMHRAFRLVRRIVGILQACEVVTFDGDVRQDENWTTIHPAKPWPVAEPSPELPTDLERWRRGILSTQPASQTVPHVVIHAGEHGCGVVAVPVKVSPTTKDWIEGVDHILKGSMEMPSVGHLLDAVAEVQDRLLRDFDPGPKSPSLVPTKSDAMAEECESLGQRGDMRFISGERQPKTIPQVARQGLLLGMGLFFRPCDENHKVVRVPNREKDRSARLAFAMAEDADGTPGTGGEIAVAFAMWGDVSLITLLDG
jgi:hypothetical protein